MPVPGPPAQLKLMKEAWLRGLQTLKDAAKEFTTEPMLPELATTGSDSPLEKNAIGAWNTVAANSTPLNAGIAAASAVPISAALKGVSSLGRAGRAAAGAAGGGLVAAEAKEMADPVLKGAPGGIGQSAALMGLEALGVSQGATPSMTPLPPPPPPAAMGTHPNISTTMRGVDDIIGGLGELADEDINFSPAGFLLSPGEAAGGGREQEQQAQPPMGGLGAAGAAGAVLGGKGLVSRTRAIDDAVRKAEAASPGARPGPEQMAAARAAGEERFQGQDLRTLLSGEQVPLAPEAADRWSPARVAAARTSAVDMLNRPPPPIESSELYSRREDAEAQGIAEALQNKRAATHNPDAELTPEEIRAVRESAADEHFQALKRQQHEAFRARSPDWGPDTSEEAKAAEARRGRAEAEDAAAIFSKDVLSPPERAGLDELALQNLKPEVLANIGAYAEPTAPTEEQGRVYTRPTDRPPVHYETQDDPGAALRLGPTKTHEVSPGGTNLAMAQSDLFADRLENAMNLTPVERFPASAEPIQTARSTMRQPSQWAAGPGEYISAADPEIAHRARSEAPTADYQQMLGDFINQESGVQLTPEFLENILAGRFRPSPQGLEQRAPLNPQDPDTFVEGLRIAERLGEGVGAVPAGTLESPGGGGSLAQEPARLETAPRGAPAQMPPDAPIVGKSAFLTAAERARREAPGAAGTYVKGPLKWNLPARDPSRPKISPSRERSLAFHNLPKMFSGYLMEAGGDEEAAANLINQDIDELQPFIKELHDYWNPAGGLGGQTPRQRASARMLKGAFSKPPPSPKLSDSATPEQKRQAINLRGLAAMSLPADDIIHMRRSAEFNEPAKRNPGQPTLVEKFDKILDRIKELRLRREGSAFGRELQQGGAPRWVHQANREAYEAEISGKPKTGDRPSLLEFDKNEEMDLADLFGGDDIPESDMELMGDEFALDTLGADDVDTGAGGQLTATDAELYRKGLYDPSQETSQFAPTNIKEETERDRRFAPAEMDERGFQQRAITAMLEAKKRSSKDPNAKLTPNETRLARSRGAAEFQKLKENPTPEFERGQARWKSFREFVDTLNLAFAETPGDASKEPSVWAKRLAETENVAKAEVEKLQTSEFGSPANLFDKPMLVNTGGRNPAIPNVARVRNQRIKTFADTTPENLLRIGKELQGSENDLAMEEFRREIKVLRNAVRKRGMKAMGAIREASAKLKAGEKLSDGERKTLADAADRIRSILHYRAYLLQASSSLVPKDVASAQRKKHAEWMAGKGLKEGEKGKDGKLLGWDAFMSIHPEDKREAADLTTMLFGKLDPLRQSMMRAYVYASQLPADARENWASYKRAMASMEHNLELFRKRAAKVESGRQGQQVPSLGAIQNYGLIGTDVLAEKGIDTKSRFGAVTQAERALGLPSGAPGESPKASELKTTAELPGTRRGEQAKREIERGGDPFRDRPVIEKRGPRFVPSHAVQKAIDESEEVRNVWDLMTDLVEKHRGKADALKNVTNERMRTLIESRYKEAAVTLARLRRAVVEMASNHMRGRPVLQDISEPARQAVDEYVKIDPKTGARTKMKGASRRTPATLGDLLMLERQKQKGELSIKNARLRSLRRR